MNIKYLALLFLTLSQTTQCTHDPSSINNYTVQDDEQEFQEIKFIYIGDSPNIKHITFQMIAAAKDDAIKGIILLINCHGGSMTSFAMLHDTIKKIRDFKPIVAVVAKAFSAGYTIASAADHIIAHSCAEIGGIGVIIEIKHFKNPRLQEDDLETEYTSTLFKAGEFKDIYQSYGRGELSETERAYLQKNIETAYKTVVSLITNNRSLDKEKTHEWANAQSFMAHEALEMGLIDQIGTLFDAEEKIAELIQTKTYRSCPDYKIRYSFCSDDDAF